MPRFCRVVVLLVLGLAFVPHRVGLPFSPTAAGFVSAREVGPPFGAQDVAPGVVLRLLAYNIHHGEGLDGRVDLERVADVIREQAPDLVALQEVDNRVERTGGVDQALRLGELMRMGSYFGEFMGYQGGSYGMAILSRLPVERIVNHELPEGAEPRTSLAVSARIEEIGEQLVFVGVHFYRSERERLAQARRVDHIYEDETAPVVLAGDFNSVPGSRVMELLAQSWTIPEKLDGNLTYPSASPEREIDFILYRPSRRFEVIESRVVGENLASDHRPVLLVVRLLPAQ